MPRPSDKEIEESFERATGYGLSLDSEDEALLRHVLLDDEPRQGLHRHGDKPYGEPEPWEDDVVEDYLYPELYDAGFEYDVEDFGS